MTRDELLSRLERLEIQQRDTAASISADAACYLPDGEAHVSFSVAASYALDALALSEARAALEGLKPLAVLAEAEHYRAVGANALFSVQHWKHNAGPEWPDADDGSYTAFENCAHPQCKAALTLVPSPPTQEP